MEQNVLFSFQQYCVFIFQRKNKDAPDKYHKFYTPSSSSASLFGLLVVSIS